MVVLNCLQMDCVFSFGFPIYEYGSGMGDEWVVNHHLVAHIYICNLMYVRVCVYVHTHISYIRGFPQNNSVIISFVFVFNSILSITVKHHIYMCI